MLPTIIQGGMGVGVSTWRLARAVSRLGQMGVVSGTALNTILIRRLQTGDVGGSVRMALAECPLRDAAREIEKRYFIPGGKSETSRFAMAPVFSLTPPPELLELTIVACFVEVFLAKQGHDGCVGINLLEKIQLPALASLFGAMLAGVDYVLIGAGIPRAIPGVLDRFAQWQKAVLRVAVEGATPGSEHTCSLDPLDYCPVEKPTLRRPAFLAIVSSSTLALTLARKSSGRVDGFVVEGLSAGGHNAPPRGGMNLNERGEPIYGLRDVVDLAAIRALGLPFWLAGSCAHPAKLREARALGAAGVQIGTAFAFCEESGLDEKFKRTVLRESVAGTVDVRTDPRASPTGLPFKVVALPGTVAEKTVYEARPRGCDLGYLRQPYQKSDDTVGYRCPAEREVDYVRKGGDIANTCDRKCLCNGLFAAIGLGQTIEGSRTEPAIITAGEDVTGLGRFLAPGRTSYCAGDVLRFMQTGD